MMLTHENIRMANDFEAREARYKSLLDQACEEIAWLKLEVDKYKKLIGFLPTGSQTKLRDQPRSKILGNPTKPKETLREKIQHDHRNRLLRGN